MLVIVKYICILQTAESRSRIVKLLKFIHCMRYPVELGCPTLVSFVGSESLIKVQHTQKFCKLGKYQVFTNCGELKKAVLIL